MGRLFSYLILFGFACLTGGLIICPGFYLYGPGQFLYGYFSFRQIACLYFCLFVILLYCDSYLILFIVLRAGFLAGDGKGVPVLQFSGYLQVVSLSGATLLN